MVDLDNLTLEEKIKEKVKCSVDPIYYINTYAKAFNTRTQAWGNIKCFEYQEEVLEKFLQNRFNIILKARQCVKKGTFIDTPLGPKKIEDFKIGDPVYSYNPKTRKTEVDEIYDAWYSGKRNCVKFKLQDTRNIEIAENHPFLVKNKGWIKAKDLEINDEIIDSNIGFGNIVADESRIKILSYLITDGYTVKQVKFTNNNLDYIEDFEQSCKKIFPNIGIRRSKKLNGFDVFPKQKHGTTNKNPVMELCEGLGIANKKTQEKILPIEVFDWDKPSVALLINRIFAGDGWISILKNRGKSRRLEIGIASPSIHFLEQIKMLIKKFGIHSNIYEVKNQKLQKTRFFKLRITHSKSTVIFVNEIGIYKKIKQEHHEVIKARKHNVRNGSIVRKIEKTKKFDCYDISVNKNENFLINGLVTHNTGLSVITAAYVAWRMLFLDRQKIFILANDGKGAKRFLEHVKQFIMATPEWLRPKKNRDKDKWSETKIFYYENQNEAEASAASEQAGRGGSYSLVVMDEFAFVQNDRNIWTAINFALSQSRGDCIIISTPYGSGNLYHEFWTEAEQGRGNFEPSKIHWTRNPVCAKGLEYRENEQGILEPWSPWYEEQKQNMGNDEVRIAQELDLSFLGSKPLTIHDSILLDYRKRIDVEEITPSFYINPFASSLKTAIVEEKTDFWGWEKPSEKEDYIISCDVARGDAQDYSTIQVINVKTMNQAAELQMKVDPDVFANIVFLTAKLYGDAYVVIEGNNMGLATAYKLERSLGYKNLFYHKSAKSIWVRPKGFKDFKYDKHDKIPGFQTTTKTKPLIISAIRQAMREHAVTINSPRLMTEFDTWVLERVNKDEVTATHEKGYNDDLIMAFAIGIFIRGTEYDNIVKSRQFTEKMLDSWTFSNTPLSKRPKDEEMIDKKEEKDEDKKDIDVDILFFGNGMEKDEEDDDDLSWLLG